MTDEKRSFDAIAYALEADIADFVREHITVEYRLALAIRQHRRRSHLIRYRQLAKAKELEEAA